MQTLALVAPWEFRVSKRYRSSERDEYLRVRRTRGHDAAETWRMSFACLKPQGLESFVLPVADWPTVRKRFGKYAERFEDLTELEQFVVMGVLSERVEREREKARVRPLRHRTR